MVRRAILDRGDLLTADDEALPLSQPHPARPGNQATHWRGAGGRWLVWAARAIAWAVIIIIGYRGVVAIVTGSGTSTPASSTTPAASTQFPVTLAEAYALQFGDVYLNFSPSTASARASKLAAFLPAGTSSQFGWNGAGTQRLADEQVAAIAVTGKNTAVVTLLARLDPSRLIELGVPIYAAGASMSVSGYPAILPGPAKAVATAGTLPTSDQAAETALQRQLPAFFQAYASGDATTLARFVTPGSHITGLGGAVVFSAIDGVYAPAGGASRQISVTVTWQLPTTSTPSAGASAGTGSVGAAPAAMQTTYQLTVSKNGGTWDVQSIGASTEGPP